jgi:hypothetical protein
MQDSSPIERTNYEKSVASWHAAPRRLPFRTMILQIYQIKISNPTCVLEIIKKFKSKKAFKE